MKDSDISKFSEQLVYGGVNDDLATKLKKITAVNRNFAKIALWFMIADCVFVIINIIMRRFFNMPIYGATEIIRYGMFFCACFAIFENEWIDGNINMMLILERLKTKNQQFVLFIVNAFSTIGVGFVSYLMVNTAIMRINDQQATVALHFPLWIPATTIAFGFIMLTIVLGIKTYVYLLMTKTQQKFIFRRLAIIDESQLAEIAETSQL